MKRRKVKKWLKSTLLANTNDYKLEKVEKHFFNITYRPMSRLANVGRKKARMDITKLIRNAKRLYLTKTNLEFAPEKNAETVMVRYYYDYGQVKPGYYMGDDMEEELNVIARQHPTYSILTKRLKNIKRI